MSIKEVVYEAAKASPPVSVGAMQLAGYPLSDWVLLATLMYTALQTYFLLRDKWWRKRGKVKH